jgi:F-type H+-transporting ATPase subunit delta
MMNPSTRAARVYAEAMIAIGRETGTLGEIHDELMGLNKLYRENREFRAFFTSPGFDKVEKFRILELALKDQVGKSVMGLLSVMIRKGREPLLDNIADQFAKFKDIAEGKVHIRVDTARPLAEDQKNTIREIVEQRSGLTAELHETVVPELIGGTIVRVNDYVIDGSIRRRLLALKKSLVAKEQLFG